MSDRADLDAAREALHASAPDGHKCADCMIDKEACPQCYEVWWKKRHPNVHFLTTALDAAKEAKP